jgi:Ca-activated chloride channel family protein
MTPLDPTSDPRRPAGAARLRIAAVLLAVTVAAGAAARLTAAPDPGPDPGATLPRVFTAAGTGPVRFSGALEGTALLAGGDGLVRMELALGADAPAGAARAARVPTDLVVVLDRSGSMMGEKMEHARAAVRALVGALGTGDRFALVAYSDHAWPAIPLTSAADRTTWPATIEAITADGGTNLSGGLDLALAMVDGARREGRVPRVVLISDGLANQGDASREGLVARAARAARGEYALSTVGVGADFDEGLMAALADAGTGNFHFLAGAAGLDAILAAEFATARETVASGLRVVIAPAPGVRVEDAAGYPLAPGGDAVSFQPGSLFAGQERRIWVTLRAPASQAGAVVPLGSFTLEYGAGGARHRLAFADAPRVAVVADERRVVAALDPESWERSVIVDQYNALRRSVAAAAQEGREKDAVAAIQKYRDDVAARNEAVASPAVERQLEEAKKLEDRMQQAASGAAPMAPLEVKRLRALGYVEGRPGSRK